MDNSQDIKVLSLCAGYGGLDIGLSRAIQKPLRIVGVEIEAYALANLVEKTEKGKMAIEALWPDLKTFPAEKFRGCFDIITAGYPCQPFSTAGGRKGKDDPRHLWPYIEKIIKAVRPIYGFFENVPGHLTLGFPSVYRSLRKMGYCVEAGLFTAAECGMGFIGERLFILATADSLRLETHRNGGGSREIFTSRPPSQDNITDAVERFWKTARRTYRGNDGTTNRVDRLRLLGNGVVPAQAELAFRTLMEKL